MQDGYTDSLGQHVETDDVNLLTAVASVKYTKNYTADNAVMTPKARFGLTYDLVSDNNPSDVNIGNVSYRIEGERLERLGAEAGLGLEANVDNWTLSLGYDLGLRKDYQSHSTSFSFKFAFWFFGLEKLNKCDIKVINIGELNVWTSERQNMKEITQAQVDKACYLIAQKIKGRSPKGFVLAAVSRGGLVPATIISHYLKHKDIRFIRLSSYSDESKEQATMRDTTSDEIPNDSNTYIIDDLCDSGETVQYLRKKYPAAQIYTLINKNDEIQPDYFPMTEPMGVWINFPWEPEDRA